MEYSQDQTKIHFNPDFISRGGTLPPNQKVHINPAFLQKPQGVHQTQNYVTPAVPYASTTGHGHHWQGPTSGAHRPASHITASLSHSQDRNTDTNVYSYSSNSIHDRTVLSNHPKNHSSFYNKSNVYNPYDKRFSTHSELPQSQNIATKNPAVVKHPSTYSWKATNANSRSPYQRNSYMAGKRPNVVNMAKDSPLITQRYVYPNTISKYPSANKSFIRTRVVRRVGATQAETHPKKDNPIFAHSSLHSISHDKNNIQSTRNLVVIDVTPNVDTSTIKTEPSLPTLVASGNSGKVTENTSQSLPVVKIKSELNPSDTLTQDPSGTLKAGELLTVSKREPVDTSTPSEAQVTVPSDSFKPIQLAPSQKWVSNTKVVNSSKKSVEGKDIKSSGTKVLLKTPKQKGNYKIITKTKLVRSNSATKNKVQLQAVTRGHPAVQTLKTTTHASPRVTTISRLHKLSPLSRIHQTASRFSTKKKYSVLSHTKLVRRQSLSGKAGTPGKPKYTVNTKNKLIRRRSSSGTGASKSTSKTSESKAKSSKPEAERQKKFHVLSKTKIVRRRSSSGTYKVASTQGLVAAPSSHPKKRAIVKRHKLVRNVSLASLKHETTKFPRNVNTAFKVINSAKFSTKQKIAKGIVSKYKINRLKLESYDGYKKYHKSFDRYKVNRLKLESVSGPRRYRRFSDYSSRPNQKDKFKFQNKKTSKHSDRFINIGGILYKSTKTSLRKQLPKVNDARGKKHDSTCTVLLRGEKFHLTAGGRTLQRVKDSTSPKSSLPRVHLGGLTYSRTRTGLYELTKTHQARAVLSSARHRSMVTLIQKRKKASFQKRNEYCVFFNRFGRCSKKNRGECPYIHDPSRVAICTRFLRGRCPVNNCPFSHTVDPDKMPVCSHFLQTACTREDCPYRHVRVNPAAPVCLDFVRGHCKAGKECDKQHVLICEDFKTGKCPRGTSCPLSHHKGRSRIRKVSFSKDSNRRYSISIHRKRKISENLEVLGGPVLKKKVERKRQEVKPKSTQQRYFHVMAAEGSEDKDPHDALGKSEQKVIHKERSQNTSKTQSEAQSSESDVQKDKIVCDGHSSKSVFDETRSRVMRKIDQIKKSYSAYNCGDCTENTGDCKHEPRNSHHPINTNKEKDESDNQMTMSEVSAQDCNDTVDSNNDANRVQRPPLPKRLPSYIPLDSV